MGRNATSRALAVLPVFSFQSILDARGGATIVRPRREEGGKQFPPLFYFLVSLSSPRVTRFS